MLYYSHSIIARFWIITLNTACFFSMSPFTDSTLPTISLFAICAHRPSVTDQTGSIQTPFLRL